MSSRSADNLQYLDVGEEERRQLSAKGVSCYSTTTSSSLTVWMEKRIEREKAQDECFSFS